MENSTTIIAPASPNGAGALSILRISGKEAHSIVLKNIKEKDKFCKKVRNLISRYTFIDSEENFIDEITAIKYDAPVSYTGENMVEIICHGSKFIVFTIMEALQTSGAVLSKRGEFTQRAFLNGKIDLIKAENVKMLIECNSNVQKKINQNIHNQKYRESLNKWIETIQDIIALIETEIEFYEDVAININEDEENKKKIQNIYEEICNEIKRWRKIEQFSSGIKIVIAGPSNAGKSSLFNKLLGYERAIVTEIPGTTRDTISEKIIIENNEIILIDTAGIRETGQKIEKKGIERSYREIDEAHIVLWIIGSDQQYEEPNLKNGQKVIKIINKIDMLFEEKEFENKDLIKVSIEKNINVEQIIQHIIKKINEIDQIEIPEVVNNQRQLQIVENIKRCLDEVIKYWNEKEKAAYYLYKSLDEFEEYYGKRDKETIYNKIFETFCIGK